MPHEDANVAENERIITALRRYAAATRSTPDAMATLLRVDIATLTTWLTGTANLNSSALKRVAERIGVPPTVANPISADVSLSDSSRPSLADVVGHSPSPVRRDEGETISGHLFMDYQNVHLSAHEAFESFHTPKHKALIDPGKFASQVAYTWNNTPGRPELVIRAVSVFRGLPSRNKEHDAYRRSEQQHRNWSEDPRVAIHSRGLKYYRDWPDSPAQEKGVDVMLAIAFVRAALEIEESGQQLILASRDTDLMPAVETAESVRSGCVMIATWESSTQLPVSPSIPVIGMKRQSYQRSRDTKWYQ